MTPQEMTTEVGGVQLDDATYELKCIGIEDCTLDQTAYNKPSNVPGIKFLFQVVGFVNDEGNPVELSALATAEHLRPRTKLYRWANALGLDIPKDPGHKIKFQQMVGRHAMGVIVNKPDSDGQMWARIEDLVALPTAMQQTAPAPVEPAAQMLSSPPQSSPGPPVDPWQGFRTPEGHVDWNIFAAYLKKEGLQPGHLADYMGVGKADPASIRDWTEAGPGRTALQLILETMKARGKQVDPDEIPFE